MYRSAPAMPARRATSETVTGLSPEMTRMDTPSWAKKRKVSGAVARMRLDRRARAMGRTCSGSRGLPCSGDPRYWAMSSTRQPWADHGSTSSRMESYRGPRMNSGAPTTKAPSASKTAADHLVWELKGTRDRHFQAVFRANISAMARPVSFSGSVPLYRAARTDSRRSGVSCWSRGMRSWTSIPGSVMVPVLSTHSTSTRARVSMQFMSWTRTFCWASFMAETAMATLVSRYSPSGIMPMRAATVDWVEVRKSMPSTWNWR